jgi:hypothetical protein
MDSVDKTINECDRLLFFQLIAKAGSKYGDAVHLINDEPVQVQKVNRVYAAKDHNYGTLYKTSLNTGSLVKIAGLPPHCIVDNDNHLTIDVVDRAWYIRLAERYVKTPSALSRQRRIPQNQFPEKEMSRSFGGSDG